MWNVVQIKTLYEHFSAQICLPCSFSFQFNLFILNWGRANKTTLLRLFRLQNKAVRTFEDGKTKAAVLYPKHKILEISNLIQ